MASTFTPVRNLFPLLFLLLMGFSGKAQLPGYASFQSITITNTGTSLITNYQAPVIFNTQALISTSQMLASGADIRFSASCSGGIIFPHYLDTGLNTTATRIWVKIDTLFPSSSRVIYLSYNNPSATNVSTLTIFNGPFSSTNQVTGGTAGGVALCQRGFRFAPNTDVLVTQFGKNEPTGTTRTVTLFDNTSTAILRQGTVSGSAGVYSYNNLANPIWLTSGTQYVIQLYQGAGDGYYFGTSSQINSNLTYYDMRYCNSCLSTTFPTSVLTNYHYGYPDFNFYTRNIVSPAPTVALGGTGGSAASVTISASPAGTICNGGPVTFTANPINGGTAPTYQWYKNSTAVGTGPTYSITTPVNGDQVYVTMVSNSVCATTLNATSNTITLAVGTTPSQPGTITGLATPCTGSSQTYSISSVTSATSYAWTVPTGWTIVSGQGTVSITTTVGAANGNISVTASNPTCGNSPVRTLAVTVATIPATPGPITGNTVICGASSQTYSVAAVTGATTYNWSLPVGWTITAGAGTNSITATPSVASGIVSVTAGNACGSSAASSLSVTSGTFPPAPAAITGNTFICAGSTNSYSVPAVAGLTYNWSVPTGWTFTQTNNSIVAVSSGVSGNVSVTASNGTCGTSFPTNAAVVVNPILTPAVTVTNSSTSNSLCSGTIITFTANGTGGGSSPVYQWKKNGVNVGSNSTMYVSNSLQNGDVITVVLTSNAPCLTAATGTSAPVTMTVIPTVTPGVSINTTPPTASCQGAPINFTTIITGGGSAPTYQWYKNNIALPGITTPTYNTSTISNSDTISVIMTSNSVCATAPTATSNKVGLTIIPNVVPSISISANPSTTVSSGTPITFTASVINGGAAPGIQWKKNNQPVPFENSPTYTSSTLVDGDVITATLTSYALCASPVISTSAGLRMSNATAIDPKLNVSAGWDGTLSLYPNPNGGHFTISCTWGANHKSEKVKIEIVNILGQRVYVNEISPNALQWTVPVWLGEEVANGLYQLHIRAESMSAVRGISIHR